MQNRNERITQAVLQTACQSSLGNPTQLQSIWYWDVTKSIWFGNLSDGMHPHGLVIEPHTLLVSFLQTFRKLSLQWDTWVDQALQISLVRFNRAFALSSWDIITMVWAILFFPFLLCQQGIGNVNKKTQLNNIPCDEAGEESTGEAGKVELATSSRNRKLKLKNEKIEFLNFQFLQLFALFLLVFVQFLLQRNVKFRVVRGLLHLIPNHLQIIFMLMCELWHEHVKLVVFYTSILIDCMMWLNFIGALWNLKM